MYTGIISQKKMYSTTLDRMEDHMSFFGFDWDMDGKVDFAEHMLTMDMMGAFDDEKQHLSPAQAAFRRTKLESDLAELENDRSDLEDALFDAEMHEPDILSPVYDAWSAYREALLDQIDQLDSDISDLEDSIRDLGDR